MLVPTPQQAKVTSARLSTWVAKAESAKYETFDFNNNNNKKNNNNLLTTNRMQWHMSVRAMRATHTPSQI